MGCFALMGGWLFACGSWVWCLHFGWGSIYVVWVLCGCVGYGVCNAVCLEFSCEIGVLDLVDWLDCAVLCC